MSLLSKKRLENFNSVQNGLTNQAKFIRQCYRYLHHYCQFFEHALLVGSAIGLLDLIAYT